MSTKRCRVKGCECMTETREIWGAELFPHSLDKSYGLGWVDGAVAWEQFLSAMWGEVISKARGKVNLKEKLSKEIRQHRLSVQSFLSVDIPEAKSEIMRFPVSLGLRPTDKVVLCKGYCHSIAASFSSSMGFSMPRWPIKKLISDKKPSLEAFLTFIIYVYPQKEKKKKRERRVRVNAYLPILPQIKGK